MRFVALYLLGWSAAMVVIVVALNTLTALTEPVAGRLP